MVSSIHGPAHGQSFPSAARGGGRTDPRPQPSQSERVDPLIDGSRLSSAPAWDNNFCLIWNDSCNICSRNEIRGQITCQKKTNGDCRPSDVRCTEADANALYLSCASFHNGMSYCTSRLDDWNRPHGSCINHNIPSGTPVRSNFQCLEDWGFQERWYCSRKTPKAERHLCNTDQIARTAAERAARPDISFPGLRR